ncbi:hypothetical protein WICMUC_005188 [Wickerhamomyces mucosus]|uniref:Uncharacterized protein n=1 Tax=Wickerhamomyces mucosus TaxID=1378264 RepID=A0A9P8T789_9ASCO|nr:hypothetical protein WICMUC_005188 [Wickerhamomyces mucosus]
MHDMVRQFENTNINDELNDEISSSFNRLDLDQEQKEFFEDDYSDSDVTTEDEDEGDSHDKIHGDNYDMRTRISNEIKQEEYVCLICTCEISSDEKFWSCDDCFRVYHISCVNSWSKQGSSTDDQGNWSCPACNSSHRRQKFQHRCWCKKSINPEENPLNPGSCGQTCGAKLEGCPHRCSLPCHPGPHAICNALGPEFKCHCGNHKSQWPCVLTPYVEGWHCEDICEEYLPCEIHKCNKVCHTGLCGKCDEFLKSKCYCGRTTDMIKCSLKVPKKSFGIKKSDNWIGNFECSNLSEVHFDCKKHSKFLTCQPIQRKPLHCPLSVDSIKTCHCGQTPIEKLTLRLSCTDSIPACDQICNKILPCGHNCKWSCHEGECSPCYENLKVNCRCGQNQFIVPCKFLQSRQLPKCTRKCPSLLSCRRHRCNKICCEDEATSAARERQRKKNIRNNTANPNSTHQNETFSIEANHICLQICNKKLTCGNSDHLCQRTCHTGPCSPCLESSNDDLICHCGQTVVLAPVRCGRKLPPCEYQCVRDLPCGHSQMPHNCHENDIPCQKCTKTVEKWCNCGKSKVKAMCYQEEVFCPDRCGKKLSCQHTCMLSCHKEESGCVCKSICGKKKKYCNHIDRSKCHFPERCNDTNACDEKLLLSCKCGNIKKETLCGANKEKESSHNKPLDCEISCVIKEREERLQKAFGIIPKSEAEFKIEDLPYTAKMLKISILQSRWCLNIESIFKKFMSDESLKNYHFQPMRREQREYIYEMAEAYFLYGESQDREPHRSVFISKRAASSIPKISLTSAMESFQRYSQGVKLKSKKATQYTSREQIDIEEYSTWNSILITDCIVGVTLPEIEESIEHYLHDKFTKYDIKWIGGDRYIIILDGFMKLPKHFDDKFNLVLPFLRNQLASKILAYKVAIIKIDENFTILKEKAEERAGPSESVPESDTMVNLTEDARVEKTIINKMGFTNTPFIEEENLEQSNQLLEGFVSGEDELSTPSGSSDGSM